MTEEELELFKDENIEITEKKKKDGPVDAPTDSFRRGRDVLGGDELDGSEHFRPRRTKKNYNDDFVYDEQVLKSSSPTAKTVATRP